MYMYGHGIAVAFVPSFRFRLEPGNERVSKNLNTPESLSPHAEVYCRSWQQSVVWVSTSGHTGQVFNTECH